MKVKCEIEMDMKDEPTALNIASSIKVDDDGFVKTRIEGKKILATIETDNIPSLMHTIEDYMACISIADKASKD